MISSTALIQITDSISQGISDMNTCFIVNPTAGNPSPSTIIAGVSGTTTANTYGRVLNSGDSQTELLLLQAAYVMGNNIAAFAAGIQSTNGIYQQFFVFFDKLDQLTNGLNTFLAVNTIQVNGWFARAYNYWCTIATQVTPGRTSANAPIPIQASNYFPIADIDSVWTFTTGTGTAMINSQAGINSNGTADSGGGVGQVSIYKLGASAAAGVATFTITYKNASGTNATATYTTAAGTPAANGLLTTSYPVIGATGTRIVSVTGTGMTNNEQYVLGIRQIRGLAGY